MVAAWVGVLRRTGCREGDSETRPQWNTAITNSRDKLKTSYIIEIHLIAIYLIRKYVKFSFYISSYYFCKI